MMKGSLRNNDGDSYELKRHMKMEFALPQTYPACSISFNPSNVGECFWSWIIKDCIEVKEKKGNAVVLFSRPRGQIMKLGIFTS